MNKDLIEFMDIKIKTQEGLIYVWFDESSSHKRNDGLSKSEVEKKEVKRKIKDLYPTAVLEHEENGAPILKNTVYPSISISHFRGWYALYFSDKTNGIDLQTFKKTLLKGKGYFVNSKDEELPLTELHLHLIWSAKEAFYKKKKGNIQDLKNDVSIKEINFKTELVSLESEGLIEYLNFQVFQDFVLVWT